MVLKMSRAGVLVLGTRTRSTRVMNFWYSYCTRTREFESNSTRTCTRGQVLRYSYEYWHEYWYSMVHLMICDVRVKNHHTCEINSLTYHEGKVPHWFILLLWLNIWHMGCDCKFHNFFQFYYHRKISWIIIMMFGFIVIIRPSPFSHLTSGKCMKVLTSDFKKRLFSTYFLILLNFCFLFLNWQQVVIVSHDSQ